MQLKVAGGGAVGPPFTLSTANTSNAWLTTISLSGGTVSAPITLPSPPVTISPLVISEAVADAFGPAGTASDVCLDTSFNSSSSAPSIVWASVPTSATTGGVGGDGVNGVTIETGPAGPSSRLKVSIQNAPSSVREHAHADRHEDPARHHARQGPDLPHRLRLAAVRHPQLGWQSRERHDVRHDRLLLEPEHEHHGFADRRQPLEQDDHSHLRR